MRTSAPARPNAPRPSSSLSLRPPSRSSQRPTSSLSVRLAKAKHAPRLVNFSQQLVSVVIGIRSSNNNNNNPQFDVKVDETLKALDNTRNYGPSQDRAEIERRIHGLARKARTKLKDTWADALEHCYDSLCTHLKANKDSSTSDVVNESNIPEMLQFFLALSDPVDGSSEDFAEDYMERLNADVPTSDQRLYEKIMMEEPFEGQHWEGAYGLPIGWTVEGYETMVPSSPSDSSLDDWDIDARRFRRDKSNSPSSLTPPPALLPLTANDGFQQKDEEENQLAMLDARVKVGALVRRQYWKEGANLTEARTFDLGIPSTLGPAINRMADKHNFHTQKYILEVQAVREMLFLLQGNATIFFDVDVEASEGSMFPRMQLARYTPGLRHISPSAFHSMLDVFKSRSQSLHLLRNFSRAIYSSSRSSEPASRQASRTLEAFSAAVEDYVLQFDRWCANKEESICKSAVGIAVAVVPVIASLLNLERETRLQLGDTVDCLTKIINDLHAQRPSSSSTPSSPSPFDFSSIHPTLLTKLILDSLLLASRRKWADGDEKCSTQLMEIFVRTAEPLWRSVGVWLKRGADIKDYYVVVVSDHVNIDASNRKDFPIHRQDVPIATAAFWSEGYTLCGSASVGVAGSFIKDETVVPLFLANIASELVAAGKSVGLLRSLNVSEFFSDENTGYEWLRNWPTLKDIIRSDVSSPLLTIPGNSTSFSLPDMIPNEEGFLGGGDVDRSSTSIDSPHDADPQLASVDSLASLVHERLLPWCQLAQARFTREIIDQCGLWTHMRSIGDLFLGQKGDAMTLFCDVLSEKIRQDAMWTDYHFLNSTFRQVALSTPNTWIDPDSIRFSYRGAKRKAKFESIRQLEGLSVEYQMPFPLTYMLGPAENEIYSSILVILLQLKFARSAVERIHIKGVDKMGLTRSHPNLMKLFYSLRARFVWLIATITTHFITNVIHSELLRFNKEMKLARSFDRIIEIHSHHLSRLQSASFLTAETSSVHKGLISILDLALHFTDLQRAFLGEHSSVSSLSRHTIRFSSRKKRRLNRRQKQLRRDVVSFADDAGVPLTSDSEDSEAEEREEAEILRELEGFAADEDEDEDYHVGGGGGGGEAPVGMTSRTMDDITLQTSMAVSVGPAEGNIDFEERVTKMDREIDVLVRYLSRRVEELSNGDLEEAESFAKLAFILDDWDL
ncbi:Spc98 family-domain-containing protein [Cantharellus anzutake]|uniref:Spc98 family-domain-containing protein n=1 Tax=Cantharellus anzutake TaxID=1750568 RepID=UPI0019057FA2|nr:Spc98 family-domain-containing protein [Cantharellus anzutake]KAF8338860.1 Spc98 family-domain-containing protein [Cantharellus anzutake]